MANKTINVRPTVMVVWLLSELGRRELLKRGGDGKRAQVEEVKATDDLVDLARVDDRGNAIVRCGFEGTRDNPKSVVVEVTRCDLAPEINRRFAIDDHDEPATWEQAVQREIERRDTVHQQERAVLAELRAEAEQAVLEFMQSDDSMLAIPTKLEGFLDGAVKQTYQVEARRRRAVDDQRSKSMRAEREEQARQRHAEREVERERLLFEAREWARDHGSERLREIAELGYIQDSLAVYRDERLAHEFPGARWESDEEFDKARNPQLGALQTLKRVGAADNAAYLQFARWTDLDTGEEVGCQVVVFSPAWAGGNQALVEVSERREVRS